MSSQNTRPNWWQLYLTFLLLIVLFIVDSRLKISTREHQVVQIGIVLLVYGLMYLWVRSNARALRQMDRQQYQRKIMVIQVPASPLSEPVDEHSLMSGLPGSEIKGMLSDTFEMEYIDAVSLPVDEVLQESKKE